MISDRKKYLIHLFLKKCTVQNINKAHINFMFQLLERTYIISEQKLSELKLKYTLNEYIDRIIPIIDSVFTEKELQECIRFFSSETGRKLLDHNFLQTMGKIGSNMMTQLEQEFAIKSKENA